MKGVSDTFQVLLANFANFAIGKKITVLVDGLKDQLAAKLKDFDLSTANPSTQIEYKVDIGSPHISTFGETDVKIA